jgi:hypothetical protein
MREGERDGRKERENDHSMILHVIKLIRVNEEKEIK